MKVGRVQGASPPFTWNVELSDPPIYSSDGFIQSKDGMCWVRAAPHAAVPAVPTGAYGTSVASCCAHIGGCAPAPGPFQTFTIGGETFTLPGIKS